MMRRLIANLFWTLSRWRLETTPAPARPTILIGAPHTSNWDFILMLGIAWKLGMNICWIGKESLFRGPRGRIMKRFGGIPIDRDAPDDVVADIVRLMDSDPRLSLVITPDGTRGHHDHWKSGFYRIARQTGLPVTLGYVDRTTRTTGLGPTLELTGDVGADMDVIREFYRDKSGFYPDKRVEPRLRIES